MRAEEKAVDGPDLELDEEQQKQLLGEDREAGARTEGELPEFAGEEARDVERDRGTRLIDAMRAILDGGKLNIRELGLPARETRALEALQAAVTGKTDTNMFVFAEDRRSMLEQALAVLQANFTSGQRSELAALSESIGELTKRVGMLREKLGDLEDAQDELLGDERMRFVKAAAAAEGDKDDKPAKPADPDAPRLPSTLAGPGPEAKIVEQPSTLSTGPEAKRVEVPSALSTGPEVTRAEAPTTLTGAEVKAPARVASTLDGPEVKEAEKPATSLGDAAEIAKAASTSLSDAAEIAMAASKLANPEAKEEATPETPPGDGAKPAKKPWWRPFG